MTTPATFAVASLESATPGTTIDTLRGAADIPGGFGARLRWVRDRATAFRSEFAATGAPDVVATFDLVSLPYPTRFGLWRAPLSPAPFLSITNRMLLVRWHDSDGRRRTLLFEPSDVTLGRNTPYFAALTAKTPAVLRKAIVAEHGTVPGHLTAAGIDPAEVDYLVFDHLHTQDVRRWIGTTRPQPDINPDRPVEPLFPNAKLIAQRHELAAMADLHPMQRPWYQPETYRDLRTDAVLAIDADVLLGPGIALLATPGHVLGNQTLVLNSGTGIWASSENAIAAECLVPQHSRLPGLRGWSRRWQQEVVLNANTIETTADQYNSLVLEKTLVDRSQADPRFPQFFPSSELTAHRLSPGTKPTFTHGALRHGQL
ncbi:hypothetical protein [Nonomuraea guangzhouensis]|uniref:MBL fold metallo-hydrolase n=1 Tax=Nonomuraea guangzhouensis TaxID=1291555 RepID=A0ABW4G7Y8_9ACTN|nr:hypothetical protein [Nonomuraea guangzhouensis]